jgi:hypothetical protein
MASSSASSPLSKVIILDQNTGKYFAQDKSKLYNTVKPTGDIKTKMAKNVSSKEFTFVRAATIGELVSKTSEKTGVCEYDCREDPELVVPGTQQHIISKKCFDQAGCGACWAFASSTMFSDRYRIALIRNGIHSHEFFDNVDVWSGETNVSSSSEGVVNKASTSISVVKERDQVSPYYAAINAEGPYGSESAQLGCEGNSLLYSVQFYTTGCKSISSYNIRDWVCQVKPDNKVMCCKIDKNNEFCAKRITKDSVLEDFYYRSEKFIYLVAKNINFAGFASKFSNMEQLMMMEIYERGPITVGFDVYSSFFDFFKYPKNRYLIYNKGVSTIYTERMKGQKDILAKLKTEEEKKTFLDLAPAGGHAVTIVGWGENQNGQKYWIVRNSWGNDWADGGYFKIAKGVNFCNIENEIAAVFITKDNLKSWRSMVPGGMIESQQIEETAAPTPSSTPAPTPGQENDVQPGGSNGMSGPTQSPTPSANSPSNRSDNTGYYVLAGVVILAIVGIAMMRKKPRA